MADPFAKVRAGQPFAPSARAWNAFIDATRADDPQGGAPAQERNRQTTIVSIKNNSGADIAHLGVLGIDGTLFTPTENAAQFKNRVILKGITPSSTHEGKFVVLLEPVKNEQIGRGYISGVCPARLNVVSESDEWADVKNASSTMLESSSGGAARILWKEPGTGEKLGIVLLGGGGGDLPTGPYQYTLAQMVAPWTYGLDWGRLHPPL